MNLVQSVGWARRYLARSSATGEHTEARLGLEVEGVDDRLNGVVDGGVDGVVRGVVVDVVFDVVDGGVGSSVLAVLTCSLLDGCFRGFVTMIEETSVTAGCCSESEGLNIGIFTSTRPDMADSDSSSDGGSGESSVITVVLMVVVVLPVSGRLIIGIFTSTRPEMSERIMVLVVVVGVVVVVVVVVAVSGILMIGIFTSTRREISCPDDGASVDFVFDVNLDGESESERSIIGIFTKTRREMSKSDSSSDGIFVAMIGEPSVVVLEVTDSDC